MWTIILLTLFIILVIQTIFSYFQLKNIFDSVKKLKRKYKADDYNITIGASKSKFGVKGGTLIIMVLSEDNIIIDYMEMRGYSVFKRFKRKEEFINITTEMAEERLENKTQAMAFHNALDVKKEKEKQDQAIALAK